jgi:ribosomal protein S21
MPYCYGSLGVHDLKVLNDALRIFWKRLKKEGTLKSWQGVDFMVPNEVEEMSRT